MFDEPFAAGPSLMHRIDPRYRITVAVAFSFVVALADRFIPLGAAVGIAGALAVLARLNLGQVGRRLSVVIGFLALMWVALPLTMGGAVVIPVGPLVLSRRGILLSAVISLKTIGILVGFTALIATIPLSTLGHALGRMKVSKKIVYLLLMTYRYIHVLENEYRRMVRAIRMRGFRPRTGLHTYQTYAYLIGMLFVRSVARAERIAGAMRCRGFTGRFHSLVDFAPTPATFVFTAIMSAAIAWIAWLEWGVPLW